jgi:hypothetical protein
MDRVRETKFENEYVEEQDIDEVDIDDVEAIDELDDDQVDGDDLDDLDFGDPVRLNVVHYQPLPPARHHTQFMSPRLVAVSEQPAVVHPIIAMNELQQVVDDPEIINTQTRVNISIFLDNFFMFHKHKYLILIL